MYLVDLRFSLATETGIYMDLSVACLNGSNAFSGLSFHFEIGCQLCQVVVQSIEYSFCSFSAMSLKCLVLISMKSSIKLEMKCIIIKA